MRDCVRVRVHVWIESVVQGREDWRGRVAKGKEKQRQGDIGERERREKERESAEKAKARGGGGMNEEAVVWTAHQSQPRSVVVVTLDANNDDHSPSSIHPSIT